MEEKNNQDLQESENVNTHKTEKKSDRRLEKISVDKLRGRVIIINAEESEFAKKLNLPKKGDYNQKKS